MIDVPRVELIQDDGGSKLVEFDKLFQVVAFDALTGRVTWIRSKNDA